MQSGSSEKTFHLKWNNHLQNLSQLFTAIYSSSALADVTLSCRDGAIRAHKLVLSACSPYFEQIFRDNPCKHPVIILKGIPYAEINLLVEFMYKGSVDVQEIDLQSLMHTASELEVRGLAYELRKDASSLLNVNLNEYPTSYVPGHAQETSFGQTADAVAPAATTSAAPPASHGLTQSQLQANMERLQQIHMYQQSMCRNSSQVQDAKKRRRQDEPMTPTATTAVKNILAAAAKELAEKKEPPKSIMKTTVVRPEENDAEANAETYDSDSGDAAGPDASPEGDDSAHGRDTRFKGKKRVSVGEDYQCGQNKTKPDGKCLKSIIKMSTPESKITNRDEDGISGAGGNNSTDKPTTPKLKCVNFSDLKETIETSNVSLADDDDSSAVDTSDENNTMPETAYESAVGQEDEYDSSDSRPGQKAEGKIYKCDLCGLSFNRKFHMKRHRRAHSGEKPFQCNECPFSFSRSSHLARHRRTHTGERPYRCEACGRTFTRGDKLKLHLRICEKDEYTLPGRVATEDPSKQIKKENPQSIMPGMVSIGHSERQQLMFTSSGDVLLAPRGQSDIKVELNSSGYSDLNESNQSGIALSDVSGKLNMSSLMGSPSTSDLLLANQYYGLDPSGFPIKRGRGRPRKKPLPIVVPLIKKRRGRPPKIIKMDPSDPSGNRPVENYNLSNLPYGDFSYLTDILSTHFNQANQQSYQNMMQLNPMLDANKLATLMASAAVQNSLMNSDQLKMEMKQQMHNALSIKSKAQHSLMSSINSIVEDKATMSHSGAMLAASTPIRRDPDRVQNPSNGNENDACASSTAVAANMNPDGGKTNEVPTAVGDCHVSKVPLVNNTNKEEAIDMVLPSVGDCTVKPTVRSD